MASVLRQATINTNCTALRTAIAEMSAQLSTSPTDPSVTPTQLTNWVTAATSAADRLDELSSVIL
jgi:hypothetical protein